MTTIAALALLQGVFGVLRAFRWFRFGSDLMVKDCCSFRWSAWSRGFGRVIIIAIALLFVVFACGAWLRRPWATTLGIVVAIVNILLVLSALVQGAEISR